MRRDSTRKLVQRGKTIAPDAHRVLRLPVLSPYFQTTVTRRVGTGRDITLNLNLMVGVIRNLILNDPNIDPTSYADVAIVDSGAIVASATVGLDLTGISTDQDLATYLKTALDSYATGQSVSLDSYSMGGFATSLVKSPVESSISLSVQTSTGAVGTQVSSTNDSYVMVNTNVSTTATIGGSSAGDLVLEVAPTNSSTAGDWIERGRNGNSQTITLALVLQSIQVTKGQMVAFVPKGYYVKVRSITGAGSPTYSIVGARKVLI